MKLKDILKSANGNIWHNPIRTLLTVGAIFVGAYTLSLTTGIGAGVSQFLDTQVGNLGGKYSMMIAGKTDFNLNPGDDSPKPYKPGRISGMSMGGRGGMSQIFLDESDIKKISKTSGIVDVKPMKGVSVNYVGHGEQKFQLQIRVSDEDAKPNLSVGRTPDNKKSDPEIELPPKFAVGLGFASDQAAIGKSVDIGIMDISGEVTDVPATVVGVTRKNFVGIQLGTINQPLMDQLYDIQRDGLPDALKGKYMMARAHFDPQLTPIQQARLKTDLEKAGYSSSTVQDQLGSIKQFITLVVSVFGFFGAIALFAASFGVVNTLLMSVQERTKEIGLMKAMGMGSGKVFFLFSAEAVLLGFWGSFIGCVLAVITGIVGNGLARRGPLKDLEGLNVFAFPPQNLLLIMGAIMVVTFLAGALPSIRAARLDPITALRYE